MLPKAAKIQLIASAVILNWHPFEARLCAGSVMMMMMMMTNLLQAPTAFSTLHLMLMWFNAHYCCVRSQLFVIESFPLLAVPSDSPLPCVSHMDSRRRESLHHCATEASRRRWPSLYSVSQGPLTWIMGKPQCCLVHLFVNHWCFEGNAYLRMPLKGLIDTTKFVTNFIYFFAQFGYAKSHRELILCSWIWFRGPNSECILPRFCRFGDDTTSCLDERNFQFQCCSLTCNE